MNLSRTHLPRSMPTLVASGNAKAATRSFRRKFSSGGVLVLSLVLACRAPIPVEARMYDYCSSDVFELVIPGLSRLGSTKGWIDFRSPAGESFKGSWLKVDRAAESKMSTDDIFCSIPRTRRDLLQEKWSWLADVGIDFNDPPSECILMVMNGDRGTILDCIAFFNGSLLERDGIVGAAKDNRGHRYRIISRTPLR